MASIETIKRFLKKWLVIDLHQKNKWSVLKFLSASFCSFLTFFLFPKILYEGSRGNFSEIIYWIPFWGLMIVGTVAWILVLYSDEKEEEK